jgi:hypothetical protein
MDAFGIAADHRFTMWDWVGGRYSVWSAIGLIAELTVGSERFEEFLPAPATSTGISPRRRSRRICRCSWACSACGTAPS